MRIVLVGPRGSGKSTTARLLSEKIGFPVFSSDELIIKKAGMAIPDFVSKFGWDAFRDLEQKIIEELTAKNEIILDCGGGVVEREANCKLLAEDSFVVFLTGSPKILASRIAGDSNRPALTDQVDPVAEMERILSKRTTLYQALATIVLNTDNKNAKELAMQIALEIKKQPGY